MEGKGEAFKDVLFKEFTIVSHVVIEEFFISEMEVTFQMVMDF